MPPYTNAEEGLRPMGRAPRPSPYTQRVWVPWTVPRAACTPAAPCHPRAVIGRRPPARRRPVRRTPAMLRPTPGLASTWCPSYHLNRLEPTIKAPPFSTRVSNEPPSSAIGALTVNSTSGCLSSQMRAAPNSTRVPSSSPVRVLLRPSR
jgi:hypothetical protein